MCLSGPARSRALAGTWERVERTREDVPMEKTPWPSKEAGQLESLCALQ